MIWLGYRKGGFIANNTHFEVVAVKTPIKTIEKERKKEILVIYLLFFYQNLEGLAWNCRGAGDVEENNFIREKSIKIVGLCGHSRDNENRFYTNGIV